jgi:hypothetical protein
MHVVYLCIDSFIIKIICRTFIVKRQYKKRQYNQRVLEVEHGSFTPLIFTPYGGNSKETERFLAELALKLSGRKQVEHSMVMHWLRAKRSFNLLRSAVLCLRASSIWKTGFYRPLLPPHKISHNM